MARQIVFNPLSGEFDFIEVLDSVPASETFAFFMGG